ncbi:MAG: hypothetical protein LJE70_00200 [Chromatiaceae bacterium]|nr:hypothetical protein [Chromatiaceae bacterium]
MLEGEGRKDLPYPFSLPHLEFYQRCQTVSQRAERWLPLPRSHVERRVLKQLAKVLARFEELPRLAWAVSKLERGWQAFCELRDVLRLTDAALPRGDLRYLPTRELPELERARLGDIEKTTTAYREQLRKRLTDSNGSSCAEAVLLKYRDRYADHLFGHPAKHDEDGKIIAVVERTNNLSEHYFGTDKQKLRRRLGRVHLGRDPEDQPAQAALASNLHHGDYVRVLCGSLEHLPTAFAEADQAQFDTTPLVDQRLVRSHHIAHCDPEALALYLFLVTVADVRGLSFYADASIGRLLSLSPQCLAQAREVLVGAGRSGAAPGSKRKVVFSPTRAASTS